MSLGLLRGRLNPHEGVSLDFDRLELKSGPAYVIWISTTVRLMPSTSKAALDELAGHEDPRALLQGLRRVPGNRAPCRRAKEPVVDVPPLAVVLAAVADRNGEVLARAAPLWM